MKWFEGSIPAAIQQAKENRTIFIVYISGKDDISKQMDSTWASSPISSLCDQNRFVALRLEANSDSCAQFCVIYPVVCVPCSFFIGENGVALEVTGGHLEPQAFADKIQHVLEMHKSQLSGQPVAPLNQSSQQGAAPATTTASTPEEAAPSGSQSPETFPDDSLGGATASSPTEPIEERAARAKELVTAKQAEKSEKEIEDTKSKEHERRQLGRDMAKLKQFKEDQAKKETMDEWKREREEKKKEKERIREQIARDREEKEVRFRQMREERERATEEIKQAKQVKQAAEQAKDEAAKMERARLQFRLPDGSAVTHQFSSSDTLQTASDYLHQQVGNKFGSFTLSTHYPKRDFAQADLPKTLLDLQLAPSAVVIVLPGSRLSVAKPGGDTGGSGIIWLLLAPLITIWNFLYALLFGGSSQSRGVNDQQGSTRRDTSSNEPLSSQGNQSRNRPTSSYGLRSRQEGNIRRLHAYQDEDDDDQATYNGNSTQQM